MDGIKSFFEPDSIGLVGATESKGAVGKTVLDNLPLATVEKY